MAKSLIDELEPIALLAERFLKMYYSTREKMREGVSTPARARKGLSDEDRAKLLTNRRKAVNRNISK